MPDASEDWKIAYLKIIRDMPSGAFFDKSITPKEDLIWIQDLWRDGYISAKFRMGYLEDGKKFADSTVPNLIWDVHILDKGRQFIKEWEHKTEDDGKHKVIAETTSPQIHNKKDNATANGDSGESATPNNKEGIIIFRDAIGLVVSGIFATIFFETGHKVIGIWCSFIGLAAAFHVPFHHHSITKSEKRGNVWGWYILLMAVIAIWFASWSNKILHPVKAVSLPSNLQQGTQSIVSPPFSEEPTKIWNELDNAKPIEQGAIIKSFIGAKVKWLLKLQFIDIGNNGKSSAQFQDADGFSPPVFVQISDSDLNLLRLAPKDAPFYVSGNISDIGLGIQLTNGSLEAYPNNTSIP